MVYGKRSYGHRRKSGYRRVINMKEGKINSFSSSQLIYPEDGASITAVVAESTGGGEEEYRSGWYSTNCARDGSDK